MNAPSLHNIIRTILGHKGYGKTTLVKTKVMEERRTRGRVLVVDTMAEFADVTLRVNLRDAARYMRNDGFALSVVIMAEDEDALDDVCALAWNTRDMLVVLDEASRWQTPSYIPSALRRLLSYGRHAELDQIYSARRPTELHRLSTSECDFLDCFAMREPRDLAYLRAYISEDVAATVQRLPHFSYVEYSTGADSTIEVRSVKPLRYARGSIPTAGEPDVPGFSLDGFSTLLKS